MTAAHLHLLLNHFPIIGLILSLPLLLAGIVRRNPELTRAGIVTLVLVAVIAIPVYLTGEPAEEVIEHLPAVSEELIERHESAGLVSLFGLELLGVLSFSGLVVFRRPRLLPGWLAPLLLALAVTIGAWVGWTSYLGGQVSHREARSDFDSATLE